MMGGAKADCQSQVGGARAWFMNQGPLRDRFMQTSQHICSQSRRCDNLIRTPSRRAIKMARAGDMYD